MKISVALCTYNGEKFLRKQIDSILNQTIKVDEIIVCDDCSTDNTLIILEEYKKDNPGIFKIHQNEINLKSNKNFEKVITLTTGDYIFLSDQDDIWRNDKVEKTLSVFTQNKDAEGVFSDAALIDEKENTILENLSLWSSVSFYESNMNKPIDLFKFLLTTKNFLTGATLCIKKEVKNYCLPFCTSDYIWHDEWLALGMTKRKTLYYTTDKLLFYRLHDSQQLGVGDLNKFNEQNEELINEKNNIIKSQKPESYKDYKFLTSHCYTQYERLKDLKENYSDNLTVDELLSSVTQEFININLEMKKKYPIRYFLRKRKQDKKDRMQIHVKY